MAGKTGYHWVADRIYEDLGSLKKHARVQGRVQEVRYSHIMATGGAGAATEIQEAGGNTIAYLGAEAQVYIWGSNDDASYDDKTIAVAWLDDAGVVHAGVSTIFNGTTTTAVAVTGASDFYRIRPETIANITPASGHYFAIGKSDKSAIWGCIEENNYWTQHSRYFVPTANEAGKTMYAYLGKMRGRYSAVVNPAGAIEYCTLSVTCTPASLGFETTLAYRIQAGEVFEWEAPFQLQGATDTTFVVTDDAATGGNFEFEYVIVEVTRLV